MDVLLTLCYVPHVPSSDEEKNMEVMNKDQSHHIIGACEGENRSILYIMELRRSVFLGPFRILRGVPYS